MKYAYIVFAGQRYYPRAGVRDLQRKCTTLAEANAYIKNFEKNFDWCQIVETNDLRIVTERWKEDPA